MWDDVGFVRASQRGLRSTADGSRLLGLASPSLRPLFARFAPSEARVFFCYYVGGRSAPSLGPVQGRSPPPKGLPRWGAEHGRASRAGGAAGRN